MASEYASSPVAQPATQTRSGASRGSRSQQLGQHLAARARRTPPRRGRSASRRSADRDRARRARRARAAGAATYSSMSCDAGEREPPLDAAGDRARLVVGEVDAELVLQHAVDGARCPSARVGSRRGRRVAAAARCGVLERARAASPAAAARSRATPASRARLRHAVELRALDVLHDARARRPRGRRGCRASRRCRRPRARSRPRARPQSCASERKNTSIGSVSSCCAIAARSGAGGRRR